MNIGQNRKEFIYGTALGIYKDGDRKYQGK